MKIPFRYQTTEYDCVPTSFINALQYLFERDEIPPIVIQKIMQYSLDTVSKHGELGMGGGTTRLAIQMLLQWLESYTKGSFSLSRCEFLLQDHIHLRQGNKIMSCINSGGIALLRLCLNNSGTSFHYALALGVDTNDRNGILFFDPLYRVNQFRRSDLNDMQWLGDNETQKANLRVSRDRLDSYNYEKYSMGPTHERECCLLERY